MNAFLAEAKAIFQNLIINPYHYNNLKVVLCNESCDLDSVICCLVYGFALYHEGIQDYHAKYVVLPLLNVSQEDFKLKTEVLYFLKRNNIELEHVPTRGVQGLLDLTKIQDAGELDLYLVDHHTLLPYDEVLKSSVVEVIDHRPRDPNWPWDNIPNVTIENVGSCATLVAKKIKERDSHLLTKEIATLLLGPILVDTSNLSPTVGRATPLDEEIAVFLESIAPVNRQELFNSILQAKTDISSLTTLQVLKKDLKLVSGVPIASVPVLINDLRNREDFKDGVSKLQKVANSCAVILVGAFYNNDIMIRDLAVYANNNNPVVDKFVKALMSTEEVDLKLEEVVNHGIPSLRLFNQGNNKATRKHIVPLVIKASRN